MLAKAGEGDRAIKTKMVRLNFTYSITVSIVCCSRNIFSPGNGKQAKQTGDEWETLLPLFLAPSSYIYPVFHIRTVVETGPYINGNYPKQSIDK